MSANGGRTFDQVYLVSGFSDIQRGLDAGNARAHHQNIRVDFFDTGKEFVMVVDAADSRGHQMHGLARGFFGVGHNPGAVFADAGHLKQERVEPRTQACILKSFFMQSWRTGRHNDAVQSVFTDVFDDHVLAGIGTHEFVVPGHGHIVQLGSKFGHTGGIDFWVNVGAAVADINTDFISHCPDSLRLCLVHGQLSDTSYSSMSVPEVNLSINPYGYNLYGDYL